MSEQAGTQAPGVHTSVCRLTDDVFAPATDARERRALWLQVAFVLSIAVVPDIFSALSSFAQPYIDAPAYFYPMHVAWGIATRGVCVIVPILCLVALCGIRPGAIGLCRPRMLDATLTIGVLAFSLLAGMLGTMVVDALIGRGSTVLTGQPETSFNWGMYVLAELVNGCAEELAIWGVLYTRLRRLWHTAEWPSLLCASVLFGSYHFYQGVDGFIVVSMMGLVHGVCFRLVPRLLPLVLAHAASNILLTVLWGA